MDACPSVSRTLTPAGSQTKMTFTTVEGQMILITYLGILILPCILLKTKNMSSC